MEFLTAVGASAAYKTLENQVKRAFRHVDYLFHYERNVRKLNDELKDLGLLKERMIVEVSAARQRGDEIHKDVIDWVNRAESVLSEENRAAVRNDENQTKTRCSNGKFPDLVLHYRQCRKVKEIGKRVSEIKDKSFDTISYRPALHNSVVNKGYMAFQTRMSAFDDIMKALRDPNVNIIGMYGMGGVGKTTLAKEIALQAKEKEKLFDKVIMVTVSQTPDYEKIQCEIAENLGLEFSETQNATKAARLQRRLSKEMNILIILDDVWEKINLFDVGINFNEDQSGCKILMTSRRQDLRYSMDIRENFYIGALSEDEATKLFCKVVGDLGENPNLKALMTEVVSECAGLPLVINTVACSLKNKELDIWTNARNELRSSAPKNIDGMYKHVYPSIKLSYDLLESEEAKSLLLLCSMFPLEDTDIEVEDLLMYSVGWDLFDNVETLQDDARCKVFSLINILRDNCLLLPSNEARYYGDHTVRMHDVIRDVVKLIASEDDRRMFQIETINKLEKKGKKSVAISLFCDFSTQLPERLESSELMVLLVFQYSYLGLRKQIPDRFFEETKNLRVLYLPCACLESPPSSFYLLENLRTLRLLDCTLGDTSFIGGLKKLKILDLSGSFFEILSKEIGQLTRLQLLALNSCRGLKVIEPTVISSLKLLEELYMRDTRIKWEIERDSKERSNASLAELKNLPELNTLYMEIQQLEADLIPKDLFTKKLKRYEVIVRTNETNKDEHRFSEPQRSKVLYLELHESSLLYNSCLEKLIKQSEELSLYGLTGVTNDFSELDADAFPLLELFEFGNNDEVRYIINSMERIQPAFRNLEKMRLDKLINLQTICQGELSEDSFSKLKDVWVGNCDSLKNLFPFSNAIVGQLEKIEVIECKMTKEILICRREDEIEFPKLRLLTLKNLPELVQFLRSEQEMSSYSSLPNCSLSLFNEKVEFPNLEELSLSHLNVQTFWPDQLPKVSYMQNLKELNVYGCDSLKYLFSLAMARSFLQLKKLKVSSCEIMQDVLLEKEPGKERRPGETILFPKLNKLELHDLSNLKGFCRGDLVIKYPSLRSLKIINCGKLKQFTNTCTEEIEESEEPLFNEKVAFPCLETLAVEKCDSLKYLLSSGMVRSLLQLELLKVSFCKIMEEIVVIKKPFEDENISFSKLKDVGLYFLPSLARFSADYIKCPSSMTLDALECPKFDKSLRIPHRPH